MCHADRREAIANRTLGAIRTSVEPVKISCDAKPVVAIADWNYPTFIAKTCFNDIRGIYIWNGQAKLAFETNEAAASRGGSWW